MIDLNQELLQLKNRRLDLSFLLDIILGAEQTYEATSVEDFVQNKRAIKGTPAYEILYARRAIVFFSNVNITLENDKYKISDLTGELSVESPVTCNHWRDWRNLRYLANWSTLEKQELKDGRYVRVDIQYDPEKDRAFLHDVGRRTSS
ncbi:MAG: hypothetical protein Q7K45_02245 [Nanoarchaeota archaeon]|nr:hypothetical protein [Nanoarchaeota archaeon]